MSSAQQQQAPPTIETAAELPVDAELSLAQMSRIMDVAVALRRERSLAERELNRDETRRLLREKLREAAAVSGGTLTDAEIDAAILHYYDRLHAFEEPASSWQTFFAHLYVRRTQLAIAVTALGAAILAWSFFSFAIWISPVSQRCQIFWPKANVIVAWGTAPEIAINHSLFWPKAIFNSAVGAYGLRPNLTDSCNFPGAMPQATVNEGLRPMKISVTASAARDDAGRFVATW